MTTKTEKKPAVESPGFSPAQDQMRAAYQVHTLAQMLYGQLATANPWTGGYVHTPVEARGYEMAPATPFWGGPYTQPVPMWQHPLAAWTGPAPAWTGPAPMWGGHVPQGPPNVPFFAPHPALELGKFPR